MASRSRLRKKVAPEFTPAPTQNVVQSRPFAPSTQANPTPTIADVQAQLDHAQHFGHHLANYAQPQSTPIIQTKLTIGTPGDKYEQEADRVAGQVVQQLHSPQMESPQNQQSVQRESMPEDNELQMQPLADQIQREEMPEEDELQMKPLGNQNQSEPITRIQRHAHHSHSNMAEEDHDMQMKSLVQWQSTPKLIPSPGELEGSIQKMRGSGQPLADSIRQPMERAFGHVDFSGVKVHTNSQSDQLNHAIQAKAFTTGQDIFFRQGDYNPHSQDGQELLAHELTHVVQQTDNGAGDLVVQRHIGDTLFQVGRWIVLTAASLPSLLYEALFSEGETQGGSSTELNTTPPMNQPHTSQSETTQTGTTVDQSQTTVPTTVTPLSVPQPPPTQQGVRDQVNTFDPTGGNIINYVKDRIGEAKNIPGLIKVDQTQGELITHLAKDMADRGGSSTVDQSHINSATNNVMNKGGGGFTALDGTIYVLQSAFDSSAFLHEVVHVLSGPGGQTKLSNEKMNLNEGFTNYFAEEVAKSMGFQIYPAYTVATSWVRKFVAAHGESTAYNIYFKGNLDLLYDTLTNKYLQTLNTAPGFIKQFELNNAKTSGAFDLAKIRKTVTTKVKAAGFDDETPNDLNVEWLEKRVV